MAKQSIDPEEQRLINYLLGMTSAEEAEPIENRYFSDPNYHEQLLALEDELIHAYLRRELPAHQQQAFEDYFLASERRQKKFLATRDLLSYVDQLPPTTAKTSSVGVPTTKKTGWFTLPSFPRLIGATAVLLALAFIAWAMGTPGIGRIGRASFGALGALAFAAALSWMLPALHASAAS